MKNTLVEYFWEQGSHNLAGNSPILQKSRNSLNVPWERYLFFGNLVPLIVCIFPYLQVILGNSRETLAQWQFTCLKRSCQRFELLSFHILYHANSVTTSLQHKNAYCNQFTSGSGRPRVTKSSKCEAPDKLFPGNRFE